MIRVSIPRARRVLLALVVLAPACAPSDPALEVAVEATADPLCRHPGQVREPVVRTALGPTPGVGDALSTDARGRVYASDFIGTGTIDQPNGDTVARVELDGTLTPFLTGIAGPAGSGFDSSGAFYVAAFTGGQVLRRAPDGAVTTLASGLQGPTGVVIDDEDRVYVSLAGLTGPGTSVLRFAPDGTSEVFVDLAAGPEPVFALGGLALDDDGSLYVANFVDGRIVRVSPEGVAAPFATIPGLTFPSIGYLAWLDGTLYATGIGSNRVYAIDAAGTVTTFAGTGEPLERDGRASHAAFNGPNGIAVARSQRALWVSDTNARTLRRIGGVDR